MEEKKIGFFKRLKMAIFNLENYKIFAEEKFSKALKYAFILIAIITIVLSISTTVFFRQKFDKIVSYLENDFPDFSYENETLSVEEKVMAYDAESDARLIVDVGDVTDEQLDEYKSQADESYYSLILLKDKAIYSLAGDNYEITYSDFSNIFGIDKFTKSEIFENYFNDDGILKITFVIFMYAIIYLFISNILIILEDILIIAIFGWICSKICKVTLNFVQNCSLAVYSVTLSLILSTVYSVVNTFTNFQIRYFSLMYMIISYIYIIAAIMIIRSDPNKKVGQEIPISEEKKKDEIEVQKIDEKDKNVDEEKKEKNQAAEKEKSKTKGRKKKKEMEGDSLPDGE